MKWYINYNTGRGNTTINGTEEQAKKIADEGISYTQKDVEIKNNEGKTLYRHWYDSTPGENCSDIIRFGHHGFYDEWIEL